MATGSKAGVLDGKAMPASHVDPNPDGVQRGSPGCRLAMLGERQYLIMEAERHDRLARAEGNHGNIVMGSRHGACTRWVISCHPACGGSQCGGTGQTSRAKARSTQQRLVGASQAY